MVLPIMIWQFWQTCRDSFSQNFNLLNTIHNPKKWVRQKGKNNFLTISAYNQSNLSVLSTEPLRSHEVLLISFNYHTWKNRYLRLTIWVSVSVIIQIAFEMADICPGILYSIVWFLLAFIIGWPVAAFLAGFYIFLMPFAACIPPLESCLDQLLLIFKLPLIWAKKGVAMTPLSDCGLEWEDIEFSSLLQVV